MPAEKFVLVVTDDPELREDASYSFPSDFSVVLADDATDALRAMESRRPVLAIVDIRTGNSGGFNLTREMRSSSLADVPVLMLLERHQDSWLADQAGARRWRTKPVDGEELVHEALALLDN